MQPRETYKHWTAGGLVSKTAITKTAFHPILSPPGLYVGGLIEFVWDPRTYKTGGGGGGG